MENRPSWWRTSLRPSGSKVTSRRPSAVGLVGQTRGLYGGCRSRGAPSGDRGRPDPDPVRIVRGPAPGLQAEVGKPLDLLVRLHQLGEPADDNAPSGMGRRVVVVRLEPDEVLVADRGQLRPSSCPENHGLPIDEVVDGQDHDLTIREETYPPDGDRFE